MILLCNRFYLVSTAAHNYLKDRSPIVLFRHTAILKKFEFLRQFSRNQNMIEKNYQLNVWKESEELLTSKLTQGCHCRFLAGKTVTAAA